jgi:hypothetical protein
MRFLPVAAAFAAMLAAAQLHAQQPGAGRVAAADKTTSAGNLHVVSPGEVVATPEMWFYEQQVRRLDDPAVAFRAISAQKAADRRARLAAMRWYGFSNARPQASIDIVHGPYSPQWIGNGYQPYSWVGPAAGSTMLVPVQR